MCRSMVSGSEEIPVISTSGADRIGNTDKLTPAQGRQTVVTRMLLRAGHRRRNRGYRRVQIWFGVLLQSKRMITVPLVLP
jgi:hypothetical protein